MGERGSRPADGAARNISPLWPGFGDDWVKSDFSSEAVTGEAWVRTATSKGAIASLTRRLEARQEEKSRYVTLYA